MKILVVGDYIEDIYVFGTATRLCPEAPVPVVIPESERTSAGGAGLVAEQLREFGANVETWIGSFSRKTRTFCNGQLILRVDRDSLPFEMGVFPAFSPEIDAVVVSDYGKGAMSEYYATQLIKLNSKKPLFVDAKPHWPWYAGKNVTIFPNHQEASPVAELPAGNFHSYEFGRVVNKLGKDGCRLNDAEHRNFTLPAEARDVVDTCGAGDVFMASFVYAMVCEKLTAIDSLRFANALAGESCRHRGTYVVPQKYAQRVLCRRPLSEESALPVPSMADCSIPKEQIPQTVTDQTLVASDSQKFGILREDSFVVSKEFLADPRNYGNAQIRRQSPSDPMQSSDAPPLEENGLELDSKHWWEE